MTREDAEQLQYYKEVVVSLRCTLADLHLGGLEHADIEQRIAQLEQHIKFIENRPATFEDQLQARALRNAGLLN